MVFVHFDDADMAAVTDDAAGGLVTWRCCYVINRAIMSRPTRSTRTRLSDQCLSKALCGQPNCPHLVSECAELNLLTCA